MQARATATTAALRRRSGWRRRASASAVAGLAQAQPSPRRAGHQEPGGRPVPARRTGAPRPSRNGGPAPSMGGTRTTTTQHDGPGPPGAALDQGAECRRPGQRCRYRTKNPTRRATQKTPRGKAKVRTCAPMYTVAQDHGLSSDHVEEQPEQGAHESGEAPEQRAALGVGPEQPFGREGGAAGAFLSQGAVQAQGPGQEGLDPVGRAPGRERCS